MALTGVPVIGKNRKAYYDADGSIASPTWVEIGKCQAADMSGDRDKAEVKERDCDFTTYMAGHWNIEPTIELTVRPGNSVYDALWTAWDTGGLIGIAISTGAIATQGNQHFQAEVLITSWQSGGGHTDVTATLTFSPYAGYTTAPAMAQTA